MYKPRYVHTHTEKHADSKSKVFTVGIREFKDFEKKPSVNDMVLQ